MLRLLKPTVYNFLIIIKETKERDYKINPRAIPRPNHYEEVYKHPETKQPIFDTIEDSHPPASTTFFMVRETQNSSCRFVRSSLSKIPIDQGTLNSSCLLFGMYFQPFAEIPEGEAEIPKVESK